MYPGAAHLVRPRRPGQEQRRRRSRPSTSTRAATPARSWRPAGCRPTSATGYIAPIVPAMLDGDRAGPDRQLLAPHERPGRKLADEFATRIGATAPASTREEGAREREGARRAPVRAHGPARRQHAGPLRQHARRHPRPRGRRSRPVRSRRSTAPARPCWMSCAQNDFDVDGVVLRDGSGMSTENKVPAKLLAQILAVAAGPGRQGPAHRQAPPAARRPARRGRQRHARRPVRRGRPRPTGRGWVRAKTGSLTGVNSLAGIVLDKDNRPLVFAFLTSGTASTTARPALDTVSAALRGCGCQ